MFELPETGSNGTSVSDEGNGSEATETSSLLPQFRARDLSTPSRTTSKKAELLRSVSHVGAIFADTLDAAQDVEEYVYAQMSCYLSLIFRIVLEIDIDLFSITFHPQYMSIYVLYGRISFLYQIELTLSLSREDPTSSFTGLNGLEIAAVADCKKFLSQRVVQKIIHGIWTGDLCFWESLNAGTMKKPQLYNKKRSDPFTRLRVPRYIKAFEVLFFVLFLFLYYALLVERNPYVLMNPELFLPG